MLYKEWQQGRFRLALALVVYFLSGLFVLWSFPTADYINTSFMVGMSLFKYWLMVSLPMMVWLTVLGGVSLFSEERNQNTLSFLLTRPVTRRRIFVTKLGLNFGLIGAAFSVGSLIMFGLDRLPRQLTLMSSQWEGDHLENIRLGTSQLGQMDSGQALLLSGLVLLTGLSICSLCGLISIFTHNASQSLLAALVTLSGLGFGLVGVLKIDLWIPYFSTGQSLSFGLGMVALTLGLLGVGLRAFQRMEF